MELTSQVKSTMIPEYIRQLQTPLPELNTDLDRETVQIALSTNMISVGVDIDRLGLMIINGQPKTTAEYIQASSRVGRPSTSAGLVVTLYNWSRPRDRSHYERFRAYHRTFYRFVESTSVTPFSARARDRALHAVLIALARSLIGPLTDNQGATRMADKSVSEPLKQLVDVICQRAAQVMAEEAEETRAYLDALLEIYWVGRKRAASDVAKENRGSRHVPSRAGIHQYGPVDIDVHAGCRTADAGQIDQNPDQNRLELNRGIRHGHKIAFRKNKESCQLWRPAPAVPRRTHGS